MKQSILVIRRNNLGDAVSVLPWLQGLKKNKHGLRIEVLTNPYAAAVFKRSPAVDKTHVLPELYLGTALGALLHPTLRNIRGSDPYDFVVNASYGFSDKAAVMAYMVPGKKRVGVVSGSKRWLDRVWDIPIQLDPVVQRQHQVLRVATIGKLAGLVADTLPEPYLNRCCDPEKMRVSLCPKVNRVMSRWPDDRWVDLSRQLAESGLEVVWLGERPDGGAGDLIKPQTVDEFMDCLTRSAIVVCSEGGASHLAPALGVPTVVLSGVLIRHTWIPWSDRAVLLEKTGAIQEIGTEEVIHQIFHWLHASRFAAKTGAYFVEKDGF